MMQSSIFDPQRRYIMTRRLFYLRDKLSRQSLMSGLAELHSTCRIRGLAECERLAPVLPRRIASLI